MAFSTGNQERDDMLLRVLKEARACNSPMTVESVSTLLPPDFDVDQSEIDGLAGLLPAPKAPPGPLVIDTLPDGRPMPAPAAEMPVIEASTDTNVSVEPTASNDAVATADLPPGSYAIDPGVSPETVLPKIREDVARRQLDVANARLTKARDQMAIARGVLRERRSDLAGAIGEWQILGESPTDGLTKEQREARELRAHLAAQNEQRAARVKMRNLTATQYVQKRMMFGPGRGAYSETARNRTGGFNHDPRRGPVPKLPSER